MQHNWKYLNEDNAIILNVKDPGRYEFYKAILEQDQASKAIMKKSRAKNPKFGNPEEKDSALAQSMGQPSVIQEQDEEDEDDEEEEKVGGVKMSSTSGAKEMDLGMIKRLLREQEENDKYDKH